MKKEKEITTKRYRTSALFDCRDCGKNWEDLKTALQKAYQHAKTTGHRVRGEVGFAYHYN